MPFSLTKKQDEFLFDDGKRINFLTGSVRSGKTYVSLLKWGLWIAEQPRDAEHEYIMVGKTIGSLKRNCFGYLIQLFGEDGFKYNTTSKSASLFGRKIHLEGANDERAEQKIRGMTLAGAYCDEVTLFPESFFTMLLTRLSVDGAKLWATCNPDNPKHYIKKNYMDKEGEIDVKVWRFLLTDNKFLSKEYLDSVTSEFTGVFYNRFILGLWVKAEGLVYPYFSEDSCCVKELPAVAHEYYVSCDYGTMNPCSMQLWSVNLQEKVATVIKEYHYDGREEKIQLTDSEYYAELEALCDGYRIESVVIDPSAASFIAEIRKHGKFNVRRGNNDVIEGIRKTGTYLKDGKIKIYCKCHATIEEFGLYSWDEKKNIDLPIKEFDHAMDSIRYFAYTILKNLGW